jgi:hypothetical protein
MHGRLSGDGGAMRRRVRAVVVQCGCACAVQKARWRRGRWCGGARTADGGGAVAVQAACGRGWGGASNARRRWSDCARGGRRWRRGCASGGRRPAAQHGGGGDGGEGEGEGAVKTEDERAVANKQESNMTCGPRRFSYRQLIRRLGFERRLIASV